MKIVAILVLSSELMDYLKRCAIEITAERLVGSFFSTVITSFQFVRNEPPGDRYPFVLALIRGSITSRLTGEKGTDTTRSRKIETHQQNVD